MNDRRRPRVEDERPDPHLDQRLRAWLDSEPDRPSDSLATAALARARRTSQRSTWDARLRQGRTSRTGSPLPTGLALVSLLVAVLAANVAWQNLVAPADEGAGPDATATPSASAPLPFDGRGRQVLALERRATALGSGFGSLWLGDEGGRLLRIEPVDTRVVATIDLGGVPCGPIVAAAASIWLTTCGSGGTSDSAATVRIDPDRNEVVNRYDDAGGDGSGVAAMNGLVWFITDVEGGRLTAVDSVTGAHVRDLTVGIPIRHLTAGFGSLWVSPIGRPAVPRLDPNSGAQQAEVALSGDAGYLVTAADAIWVAEPHQWLVGRIDPVADRVSAEFGGALGVSHLVIAESGLVWALADGEALAFDPVRGQQVDRFPVPSHVDVDSVATHVLAAIDGSVWFADELVLLRIEPAGG